MDKLFLDTNIVVDFLCERGAFYLPAAKIFTKGYNKEVELYCSSLTYATASYLMKRSGIGHLVEDAMQYFSAKSCEADMIITRNKKDFLESELPLYQPNEYLDLFPNN